MSSQSVHALSWILGLALLPACLSVQDFGGESPAPPADEAPPARDEPTLGGADAGVPMGAPSWQWFNPMPTPRTLFAVGGTSESDVWVTGEGGTVAHFDGARWDLRKGGSETRYFAVGARAKNDAWFAGEVDGTKKVEVVHFDGKDWVKSYPFAGSELRGFSHGPGKRLFAIVDWEILELSDIGEWRSTDTRVNDVFGPPVDVWVASSGAAWALTTGAKVLRLAPASTKWTLEPPVPGVATGSSGVALSGAGAQVCAFYTGPARKGLGFMRYDGAWQLGPMSTSNLTPNDSAHGVRAGCLADESGVLAYEGDVFVASTTSAPSRQTPSMFEGVRPHAAWSPDGSKVFAVGALGAFLGRSSSGKVWEEIGPTDRRDLLAVDVGLDGSMFAASAHQIDHSKGGEVVSSKTNALARVRGAGLAGPSIPLGVAAIADDDVWVLDNASGILGVAHWTGRWSVTWNISGSIGAQPLAIWAPRKDDVWVTERSGVWHLENGRWKEVATGTAYRSIHGTGPDDIWFAGDAVAHWDGKTLAQVGALEGGFDGVWSSAAGRVWLWGQRAILYDGKTTLPVEKALHASAEWTVRGIAESTTGDVFVLTEKAKGTALLWFDSSHTKLVDVVSSDLELTEIRGRGDRLWAVGNGGACLSFGPYAIR